MPPHEKRPSDAPWTVVVAGGSGQRFGAAKQFADLTASERVIDRSVRVARQVSAGVVVVVPADDLDEVPAGSIDGVDVTVVAGGATRAHSVRAGLAEVPGDVAVICVHDGARPLADAALYARVLAGLEDPAVDGVVPGVPVADTIKVVSPGGGAVRTVQATPDRADLVAVQTPQAFRAAALRAAHAALDSDASLTDDAMMLERRGHRVVVVEGSAINRKITHPEDLEWARRMVDAGRDGGPGAR